MYKVQVIEKEVSSKAGSTVLPPLPTLLSGRSENVAYNGYFFVSKLQNKGYANDGRRIDLDLPCVGVGFYYDSPMFSFGLSKVTDAFEVVITAAVQQCCGT